MEVDNLISQLPPGIVKTLGYVQAKGRAIIAKDTWNNDIVDKVLRIAQTNLGLRGINCIRVGRAIKSVSGNTWKSISTVVYWPAGNVTDCITFLSDTGKADLAHLIGPEWQRYYMIQIFHDAPEELTMTEPSVMQPTTAGDGTPTAQASPEGATTSSEVGH